MPGPYREDAPRPFCIVQKMPPGKPEGSCGKREGILPLDAAGGDTADNVFLQDHEEDDDGQDRTDAARIELQSTPVLPMKFLMAIWIVYFFWSDKTSSGRM